MIQLLSFVEIYDDLTSDILAILQKSLLMRKFSTYHEDGSFVSAAITILNCCVLSALRFRKFYINLAGWTHAEQRTLFKKKFTKS